jgi:hypothetical protein
MPKKRTPAAERQQESGTRKALFVNWTLMDGIASIGGRARRR